MKFIRKISLILGPAFLLVSKRYSLNWRGSVTHSLVGLITLFYAISSVAQENYPAVNIVSPTATAMVKFVDFPVNLHSGVPQVDIPIYTVKEGPLTLPISLSYHASGLKVQESSSWVGAGWSLEAGGVVSRTVNGIPDEKVGFTGFSFYSNKGYSNYIFDGNHYLDYMAFINGHKDGEPDLFTFSFAGQGGKFYLREDSIPVLIPQSDIKIETILKPGANAFTVLDYIQGFKITTANGVKYYFGVTPSTTDVDPVEKSSVRPIGANASFAQVISSWYLYKIESADKAFSINLTYRNETYGYFNVSTKHCIPDCNNSVSPTKIIIDGVALDQIKFTKGSVNFIGTNLRQDVGRKDFSESDLSNDNARSLDEIQIKMEDEALCRRKFKFDYGYFENNSPLSPPMQYLEKITDRKRLKLNSIQQLSCDNSESIPSYEFYYYNEDLVPRRLSLGQDHWGFNNGAESNTRLIPPHSTDGGTTYSVSADNREAKWPEMRAGALRMIRYPTGGSTEYVYEPNTVTTTGNCSFQYSSSTMSATAAAGMGGKPAESSEVPLVVSTASFYYFQVLKEGNSGAGTLYIDDDEFGSVGGETQEFGDYLYLLPGTYTIRASAQADDGSGEGILVHVYPATSNSCVSLEKTVGGLRIKAINKFASPGENLSMRYEYESPILYSIPAYLFKLRNEVLKGNVSWPTANGCVGQTQTDSKATWYVSPISVQPLQSVQGTHIGYKRVKEIQGDGGYSIYEYNGTIRLPAGWNALEDVSVRKIDVSTCSSKDPAYPFAPLPYDPERGFLKSQQLFDKNNTKLKEVLYAQQYEESKVGGFGVATGVYSLQGTTLPTHYELKSGRILWTSQLERTFDRASATPIEVESKTYFNSAYHRMPTSHTQTSQNGVIETKNVYVPDLTQCNYECTACIDAYRAAVESINYIYNTNVQNCNNGICHENEFWGAKNLDGTWTLPQGPCHTSPEDARLKRLKCTAASWMDYQYRLNDARVTYTNCINTCKASNQCISSGVNSTNPSVKSLFLLEQANQLERIESTIWKENSLQSSTFFDYQPNATDPSKIYLKNIYGTEVNTTIASFAQASIAANAIQRDPRYSADPLAAYIFKDGQPVEIKNRNGSITSYMWGFNNTVPIVQAKGATYQSLQTAYAASSTDYRSNSLLAGAQVSSYTFDPINGVTTVTDANGRVTYYVYDKLGRLIRVKDHTGKILEETQYQYRID